MYPERISIWLPKDKEKMTKFKMRDGLRLAFQFAGCVKPFEAERKYGGLSQHDQERWTSKFGLRFRSMILRDVKVIFDMPDVEAHDSKLHDVACSNTFEKGQRKSFTSTQFNACTL